MQCPDINLHLKLYREWGGGGGDQGYMPTPMYLLCKSAWLPDPTKENMVILIFIGLCTSKVQDAPLLWHY